MTIQDDLARPWFQPVVPSEAQQQQPDPGPPTTRMMGQLPVDEAIAPAPPAPGPMPAPNAAPQRADFQSPAPQPPMYEAPQNSLPPRPSTAMSEGTTFAEALNPGSQQHFSPGPDSAAQDPIAGDTAFQAFYSDEPASMPSIPPAGPPMAPPPIPEHVEVTQPYIPAIRDEQPEFAKRLNPQAAASPTALTGPQPAVTERSATAPPRKRGLMRRVVRRIIGPDLLRKDPPKKRR